MKRLFIAALLLDATPALADDEVDFTEAYYACDEAATDEGFVEAGLPSAEIEGSTVKQIAGRWEGQELLVMTVPTNTGTVFCMTTKEYRVVNYKFKGIPILEMD